MDLGNHFQHKILRKLRHSRPVLDIGAELDLHFRIRHSFAVKDAVLINCLIKEIFLVRVGTGICLRRSQETFICSRCCDRSGIHERNGGNLAVLDLGAFTVGEVSRGMADTESIIRRSISRAEAGTAESSLHNGSGSHKVSQHAVLRQFHVDRGTCRINAQSKGVRADARPTENIRCRADIFESAAGAARDDSLFHIEFPVNHLVPQAIIHLAVQADKRFLLHIRKNIFQIGVQLVDGICIAGMEGHRDHGFDLAEIYFHAAVIISHISRLKFLIAFFPSVNLIKLFNLIVCLPDGRKAGGLRSHNVHADTEVRA